MFRWNGECYICGTVCRRSSLNIQCHQLTNTVTLENEHMIEHEAKREHFLLQIIYNYNYNYRPNYNLCVELREPIMHIFVFKQIYWRNEK
jgi:hypothetical protein